MSGKPRILVIGDSRQGIDWFAAAAAEVCDAAVALDAVEAMDLLGRETFDGVYVGSHQFQEAFSVAKVLQNEQILDGMPDGVVLLDVNNTVLWSNGRFLAWIGLESAVGANFYNVMGSPDILGPDFCPFHTAQSTGTPSCTTLRVGESRYYHLHVAPVCRAGEPPQHLIVTLRDVSAAVEQQQKMAAIHQAGMELGDLTPDELLRMSVEQRIELLKSNILHYTKDLLRYDVVEIRLLDQKTGRLEPLLSEGMEPEAAVRALYAQPQHNGVTGFVAATGKSYLCEDTAEDPLYLPGSKGARSSLTVPLVLHDEVIGTFNVESPEPRAFNENDLQFLEIFTRDVAAALNTLELLVAEKASAAAASVEAIHSAVALPIDEILNDAVNVMEHCTEHDSEVAERLHRILRNARDVKQVIQMVGQRMAPAQAQPQPPQRETGALRGRQILLVDEDSNVRGAAHGLLERFGCSVETAPDGSQAIFMVRNMASHGGYDAIIADIRLPDMTGYEFMQRLQEIIDVEPLPLVLMTGYGYDPGHSIVKARQAGLQAVLYKPFRLDELLNTVEQVVTAPRAAPQACGSGQ